MTDPVTIIYNLGAPKPNMDGLVFSLRKDNDLMNKYRALARRPGVYRAQVQTRLMELEIEGAAQEDTEQFLFKLCQKREVDRLLLSDGSFLSPLEKIFSNNGFFATARNQVQQLVAMFPDNPCEFFLEIRNPLAFHRDLTASLGDKAALAPPDEKQIRWSDVVHDIVKAAPHSKITIWRFEDAPLVWPEVLRAVTGIALDVVMQGDLDQAVQAMPENAADRMIAFLAERPELTHQQRRHVMASFLDAAVTEDGSSNDDTQSYAQDVDIIRDIENVTFID